MKESNLEMVRGMAALIVFLSHCVMLSPTDVPVGIKMIFNWGTEAVYIFFILSGIVIHLSITRTPKTTTHFLIDRFFRIVPVYLFGIVLALFIMDSLNTYLDSKIILGNIFFLGTLQGFIVRVLEVNPPIWSLTFEVFFYIVFSASMIANRKRNLKIWMMISLLSIPLTKLDTGHFIIRHFTLMFAFSSGWLVGYYISEYKNKLNIFSRQQAIFSLLLLPAVSRLTFSGEYYDPVKYLLFCIVSVPFFSWILNQNQSRVKIKVSNAITFIAYISVVFGLILFSNSTLLSKIIYTLLPFLSFVRIRNVNVKIFNNFKKISADVLGKYSYSLYILHFPILFFISKVIPKPEYYLILGCLLTLLGIIIAEQGINKWSMILKRKLITVLYEK